MKTNKNSKSEKFRKYKGAQQINQMYIEKHTVH